MTPQQWASHSHRQSEKIEQMTVAISVLAPFLMLSLIVNVFFLIGLVVQRVGYDKLQKTAVVGGSSRLSARPRTDTTT